MNSFVVSNQYSREEEGMNVDELPIVKLQHWRTAWPSSIEFSTSIFQLGRWRLDVGCSTFTEWFVWRLYWRTRNSAIREPSCVLLRLRCAVIPTP